MLRILNLFTRKICEMFAYKPGAQWDIFQGRGGFVEFGHFNKHFVQNPREKDPHGKKSFSY